MSEEIWKDIPGYEGLYKISSNGDVLSLRSGKLRKPVAQAHGYLSVSLSGKDHKKKRFYIHRLVATAFLGDPPSMNYEINHKDLDKANNTVDNLEWCTRKENMRHAYFSGQTNYKRPKRCDNTTGYKGVSKCSGGFQANINGRYLGWSKDLQEAVRIRERAEEEYKNDETACIEL